MKIDHPPLSFRNLIADDQGNVIASKLQAATFHLILAATVGWVTWLKRDFNETMFALYAGAAIGHAVIDKTGAQIAAFKNKQLEAETPTPEVTTTEMKVTEVKKP